MKSSAITFWNLLSSTEIEIPIIQRDYAQGRSGKEELRKPFLRDLKSALDGKEQMKLDFVYGTMEGGKLIPLDGQQRLTTLWLLHWYLAYRAEALNLEVAERLRKFTYETRISSLQFCENLAGFSVLPPTGTDIADHIRDQRWFRRTWRNDPTIQSMLRMISGTFEDKSDGIAGVFKEGYAIYWGRLTSSDCPIVFYHLNLSGIAHSDDLYIKMNARGKPLTSFENFKADLAGYVKNVDNDLNDPRNGLSIKMDTVWMDIFWKNRSSDNAVDEIYFAFMTRYFFNACVLQLKTTGDLQKGDNPVFDFLYGRNASSDGENEKIAYFGFEEVFKKVLDGDHTLLSRLYKTLENFSRADLGNETKMSFEASWQEEKESKFSFVPRYENREPLSDFAGNRIRAIDRVTQPHRVVFHAVCKFFEQGWNTEEPEKVALTDWMRVVWNIVENSNVDTISGMAGCLRLIDQLSERSHDILSAFSEGFVPASSFAKEQVDEEIEKARKFLAGGEEWKKKIEGAENYVFFHGAIRFLFHDEVGNEKWDDFDTKLENAKRYFDTNGVAETFRKNSLLLRSLLFKIDKSGGIKEGFWFGNGASFWRNQVLLKSDFSSVVSELLQTNVTTNNAVPANAPAWIANDALLSDAIANDNDQNGQWHILANWFSIGDRALTRYARREKGHVLHPERIIPLSDLLRNKLLSGMESDQRRGKCYFIGWTSDINFKYCDHWFRWCGSPDEGNVYLLKNDWQSENDPYMRHNDDMAKDGDQRTYYCFSVEKNETEAKFKSNLDGLIVSAH